MTARFETHEASDRVAAQFVNGDIGVTTVGPIGDDLEWCFLETEVSSKCVIEWSSGNAYDSSSRAPSTPDACLLRIPARRQRSGGATGRAPLIHPTTVAGTSGR
jgi:hypothetical protein